MNTKTKSLALVLTLILVLSALYLTYGIRQHNRQIETTILAEERTIDATVRDIERYSYSPYRARLGNMIEEHPDLVRAFAERDRARLYELARPLFLKRREENPFLHAWDFNLPDGTVFLRVQDPASFGDNIGRTREMIRAVHDRKEPVAGFDVGRHGAIFWTARPVFHQGNYVGATELGLPAGLLVDALGNRFNTPVAMTMHSSLWRKATQVGSGYRTWGEQVLVAPENSLYLQVPDEVVFSGREARIHLGSSDYVLHSCAVLRDFRGAAVGNVLVLQDITEKLSGRRRFILGGVAITGTLLALCFCVLYAGFGTLIGRLETAAAETRQAKEEIEESNSELERRVHQRTAELQEANRTLAREAAERVEMDRALSHSHDRLLRVLEGLDAVVFVADLSTYEILFANQFARENFGELLGKKCWETIQSGQAGPCAFCTNRELVGADGQPTRGTVWEFRNDAWDKWFVIRERAIPWVDGRLVRLAIATDITARKADEEKLRDSLREKDLLLKEVHHRVKNNLQIISSLLRLQSASVGGGGGAKLFRESQDRIRAMSLIHEKLYQSTDLSRIDMREYLGSLVSNLTTTYGVAWSQIRTEVDADRLSLNIDTAVICGLLVNELVSNSLKYAFPQGRGGEVRVGLSRLGAADDVDSRHQLVVSDDGIGLPEDLVPEEARTMGLQLVMMLARQQLQGEIDVSREAGTRFTVRFRELHYGSRT